MKKSAKITLTVVAVVGVAACGRRRDPCDQSYFNDMACQEAVRNGGYYYGGSWVRMYYPHPYPYYYDSYSHYVSRGGRVTPSTPQTYAQPGKTFGTGSHVSTGSSGTSHGGFGATGSGGGSSSGS